MCNQISYWMYLTWSVWIQYQTLKQNLKASFAGMSIPKASTHDVGVSYSCISELTHKSLENKHIIWQHLGFYSPFLCFQVLYGGGGEEEGSLLYCKHEWLAWVF